MPAFGARVRFVTDAGKAEDESPIGREGAWLPDAGLEHAVYGWVRLDRPLGAVTHVRASSTRDIEEV